jgi:transposase
VGDKGYSSEDNRSYLRRRGINYTIPRRANEQRGGPFDEAIYRMRNRVEQLINRLKQYRRIATRYEKLAKNYLAMLHIGSILLWL